MKRYKLKRDIPMYRAGEEYYIDGQGNLVWDSKRCRDVIVYIKADLAEHPDILINWFEEIPEEPKTAWDLEVGDDAWFIDGGIKKYTSMDQVDFILFQDKLELGDGFATAEEARKELARRKARAIILQDTKGFKPDWGDHNQRKFFVDWSNCNQDFFVERCTYMQTEQTPFATKEDAEASIEAHEKEWKIYLGVEE